ncbi:MAG: HAMP domain-containing histidine kinase [Oscillospiraceae bacterium]|nr:HAMP domain-containing histidine kinase [Oscillospiraceae bacterium]MBR3446290.1 HAMP domain-containing histidine kinase [Oscillospiraceae bacterium]
MFFTAVIFTVLWLLQTVFLQRFYDGMIIRNTVSAADSIVSQFGSSRIADYIDEISRENSIVVYLTDTDGNLLYSSDEFRKMHGMREERGGRFFRDDYPHYRELPENYGTFLQTLRASADGTAELRSDDLYVYGRYITFSGEDAVLYLGTTLGAVGSAARIIRTQLLWVTLLSVAVGFVLAWFLSRSFAKPIAQLNEKAHQLGGHQQDMPFEEGFCTELDDLNGTLDRTAEKLQQNREFQNEFLANVSHDLRTPLTMIKGYAEMIRDISREDEQQCAADVAVIVEESDRLTALVNEILEYSELQMSDKEPFTETVSLSEIAASVTDSFENLYAKDGFTFERSIAADVQISGNASRLQRAVYNLLDNAVRHAGADKWIGVTLSSDENNAAIEISDHGSGIAPDELERIWEKYYTNRQRRGKGVSGLGLAIVKQTVTMHNGKCEVSSEPGNGSTFRIILPVTHGS